MCATLYTYTPLLPYIGASNKYHVQVYGYLVKLSHELWEIGCQYHQVGYRVVRMPPLCRVAVEQWTVPASFTPTRLIELTSTGVWVLPTWGRGILGGL